MGDGAELAGVCFSFGLGDGRGIFWGSIGGRYGVYRDLCDLLVLQRDLF